MQPSQIRSIEVGDVPGGSVLLDVREDDEWDAGHAPEAQHVPMSQVPRHLNESGELTPETQIVVVCKVGGRSAQVTAYLQQQGYDATNLTGGMLAWAAAGRDMVSSDGSPPHVL